MTQKWRQMTERELRQRKHAAAKEIEQIVKKYKKQFWAVSFLLYGEGVKTLDSNGFPSTFLEHPYKHFTLARPKNHNMTYEEMDNKKRTYEREIRSVLSKLATETDLDVADSYTDCSGRVHIILAFVDYNGEIFF